jgi:hypothetical protein
MIGAARTMKHAVTLLGVPFSPHRIAVIGARLIDLGASVFQPTGDLMLDSHSHD